MPLLVDTSVLVDFFNDVANDEVAMLEDLVREGITPATAPVIVQELLQGFRDERDADRARRDLSYFVELAPPDYASHLHAARLARAFRRAGQTSSTVDTLIVAMAIEHHCDLLTRDALQKRLAAFAGVPLA